MINEFFFLHPTKGWYGIDCIMTQKKKNWMANRIWEIRVMGLGRIDFVNEEIEHFYRTDEATVRVQMFKPILPFRRMSLALSSPSASEQKSENFFSSILCRYWGFLQMCYDVTRAQEFSISFRAMVFVNAKMIERKDFWWYCSSRQVKQQWITNNMEAKTRGDVWHRRCQTAIKFTKFWRRPEHGLSVQRSCIQYACDFQLECVQISCRSSSSKVFSIRFRF